MIITGNIAVDMIYTAVQHYKKYGRKVKIVNLSKTYWQIFAAFMKEQPNSDKVDIHPDGIQFNNLLVRQGTKFQRDNLECEFEKTLAQA